MRKIFPKAVKCEDRVVSARSTNNYCEASQMLSVSVKEVEEALNKMKSGKAAGEDETTVDMIMAF